MVGVLAYGEKDRNPRLTRAQAADYLNISERTLHTLSVKKGMITYYKSDPSISNSPVWFYKKDLEIWLKRRRNPSVIDLMRERANCPCLRCPYFPDISTT